MRPEGKNQGVLHRSPDTWSWPRRRNGASHLSLQRPVHSTWPQGFRTLMSLILRPWKFTSKEKAQGNSVTSLTLALVIRETRVRFYVWRHYSGSWVKHTGVVLPKHIFFQAHSAFLRQVSLYPGLRFPTLPSQLPKYWDYKPTPPGLVRNSFSFETESH